MQHIGIDVHKNASQLCFVDENGEITEKRIKTERDRFQDALAKAPRSKVLIEASTESEWVARCIEQLGHEVIVADPNFAPMYATLNKKVKTDKRDALALCDACRLGAYRPAHRSTDQSRQTRATIATREALVRTRSRYVSLIRALYRRDGYRVPSGGVVYFEKQVDKVLAHRQLREQIKPLMTVLGQLNAQIEALDEQLAQQAREDQVAQRLCTVPGIGPVTSLYFISIIDQVERFSSAHELESYLGLVPREFSSGEHRFRGRITKTGDRRLRNLLVEAAWRIVCHPRPETEHLLRWNERIATGHGKNVAVVALARRLAGILYAIWRDGSCYQPPIDKKKAKEVLSV